MSYVVLERWHGPSLAEEAEGSVLVFDSKEEAQEEAGKCQDGLVVDLNPPHPVFTDATEAVLDMLWRQGHWQEDWEALTAEERKACEREVASDLEAWCRQGDPMKGLSPKEYLAHKAAEDEENRKEREKRWSE